MPNGRLEDGRAYLCAKCDSKIPLVVIDSRPTIFMGEHTIRRRRRCPNCDDRFTTYEISADNLQKELRQGEQFRAAADQFMRQIKEITDDR